MLPISWERRNPGERVAVPTFGLATSLSGAVGLNQGWQRPFAVLGLPKDSRMAASSVAQDADD